MTGALPPAHGVRENGVVFKGTPAPIARVLHEAGYATAAFVGAYVLDRRFGLAEGFDRYDDKIARDPARVLRLEAERRGGDVTNAALAWLAAARRPFFLWVHLYDPHAPYAPPPEWLTKAGGNAYDGEVAYADAQVARLLDGLKSRGVLDTSVIVAAGDHGEGLGEHGEDTHGMLAYDSTLRVPLIVAAPGLSAANVTAPVSLSDLAPSILRQIGVGDLGPKADLFSNTRLGQNAYAETLYPRTAGWHSITALAGEQWKLVLSSDAELYDVAADPRETRNLAGERTAIVQRMTRSLNDLQHTSNVQPAPALPSESIERLRSLGYVSGPTTPKPESDAPNPAKVIDAWREFEAALTRVNAGHARESLPALKALATRFPSASVFQSSYARALMEAGKPSEALEQYRAAVARWPRDGTLLHDLAVAARTAGETAEAMRAEQAALVVDSGNPAALNGLGLLHADAGRARDAAAWFERAAKGDPSNASYWTNLGNARRELRDATGAESAYRRALEADAAYADAANGLGVMLVQQQRAADAIPWFERALQSDPNFYEARLNLGIAYQQSGNRERAGAIYRELIAKAPSRFQRERRAAAELLRSLR